VKVAVTVANWKPGTDLCRALHYFTVIPLTHADTEIADIAPVGEVMSYLLNTTAYSILPIKDIVPGMSLPRRY